MEAVCVSERERERERGKEKEREEIHGDLDKGLRERECEGIWHLNLFDTAEKFVVLRLLFLRYFCTKSVKQELLPLLFSASTKSERWSVLLTSTNMKNSSSG